MSLTTSICKDMCAYVVVYLFVFFKYIHCIYYSPYIFNKHGIGFIINEISALFTEEIHYHFSSCKFLSRTFGFWAMHENISLLCLFSC